MHTHPQSQRHGDVSSLLRVPEGESGAGWVEPRHIHRGQPQPGEPSVRAGRSPSPTALLVTTCGSAQTAVLWEAGPPARWKAVAAASWLHSELLSVAGLPSTSPSPGFFSSFLEGSTGLQKLFPLSIQDPIRTRDTQGAGLAAQTI